LLLVAMFGLTPISYLGFFRLGLEGKFVVKEYPMFAGFDTADFKLEDFAFHFKYSLKVITIKIL
jgi:hypothetical protein